MTGGTLAVVIALAVAGCTGAALVWRVARARPDVGWQVLAPEQLSAVDTQDGRLRALERIIAGHLESREPNNVLAVQLQRLADRRLMLTHGIRIEAAPERAEEILGPEVVTLLRAEPARRLSLGQVDLVLRRIEAL